MSVHFGRAIKQLSENKGLKPEDLAETTRKSLSQIYRIFKQEHISTEVLEELCTVLGVPMSFFFRSESGTVQQSGVANILGNANQQKVKTTGQQQDAQAGDLELQLNYKLCLSEKSNLEKEVDYLKQLLKAKDEIIETLKGR